MQELECALYYAADEGQGIDNLYEEYKELHEEARNMLNRFHFLTGITN